VQIECRGPDLSVRERLSVGPAWEPCRRCNAELRKRTRASPFQTLHNGFGELQATESGLDFERRRQISTTWSQTWL